ncbi:hypothetical protein ACFFW8_09885 [Erwinia tracheiphila]
MTSLTAARELDPLVHSSPLADLSAGPLRVRYTALFYWVPA